MKTKQNIKKIKCVIFQAKNEIIERITQAINEAKDVKGKAVIAQKLLDEVEKLLCCKHFIRGKAECKICHYIADLRKRTANLILKAKELKTEK